MAFGMENDLQEPSPPGAGYASAEERLRDGWSKMLLAPAGPMPHSKPLGLLPREWKYVAALLKLLRSEQGGLRASALHGRALRIIDAAPEPYFAES